MNGETVTQQRVINAKDVALSEAVAAVPPGDWREKLAQWLADNSPTIAPKHAVLREQFVQSFPPDSLDDLTKEQYAIGYKPGSFCWWLESGTKELGSVRDDGIKKWGVWYDEDEQIWKYVGNAPDSDAEFARIRNGLVDAIDFVRAGTYDDLDDDALNFVGTGHGALRIKPLSLYFPEQFLPIASLTDLGLFLDAFGQTPTNGLLGRNRQLLNHLRSLPEFVSFDTNGMMRFLYAAFASPEDSAGQVILPAARVALPRDVASLAEVPSVVDELLALTSRTRNIVLCGPSGTGKTFYAQVFAKKFLGKAQGDVSFITFHPSYRYDDFVEGVHAGAVRPGVFLELCARAESFPKRAFVMIIDEINRADVPKVFGELITLLDDDKRIGETGATTTRLPYSGKQFGIPRNVFLIGTMNTADRTLPPLDSGLRRRFTFVEIPPEPATLTQTISGIALSSLLTRLNRRTEALLSGDHRIGHAYFTTAKNVADLRSVWYGKIVPLLSNYFENDPERLRMVLGSAFFDSETVSGSLFEGTLPIPARTVHRLRLFPGDDAGFVIAMRRLSDD